MDCILHAGNVNIDTTKMRKYLDNTIGPCSSTVTIPSDLLLQGPVNYNCDGYGNCDCCDNDLISGCYHCGNIDDAISIGKQSITNSTCARFVIRYWYYTNYIDKIAYKIRSIHSSIYK